MTFYKYFMNVKVVIYITIFNTGRTFTNYVYFCQYINPVSI